MSWTNRLGALLLMAGLGFSLPAEANPEAQNPEEEGYVYPLRDEQEIRQTLGRILANPEYRRLAPREKSESEEAEGGWIERLLEWLEQWLLPESPSKEAPDSWQLPAPLSLIIRWFFYLLVAGVVAAIVALIFKAVARGAPSADESKGKPEPLTTELSSRPPGELPSEEYLNRALALAEGADYNAAVRQLLLGTMSWIERRGLIRYRRGLSNRDYLRAIAEKTRLREPFERIVLLFEQAYFGRRIATPEGFQECLREYRKAFRNE
jgi:hypothetical protein